MPEPSTGTNNTPADVVMLYIRSLDNVIDTLNSIEVKYRKDHSLNEDLHQLDLWGAPNQTTTYLPRQSTAALRGNHTNLNLPIRSDLLRKLTPAILLTAEELNIATCTYTLTEGGGIGIDRHGLSLAESESVNPAIRPLVTGVPFYNPPNNGREARGFEVVEATAFNIRNDGNMFGLAQDYSNPMQGNDAVAGFVSANWNNGRNLQQLFYQTAIPLPGNDNNGYNRCVQDSGFRDHYLEWKEIVRLTEAIDPVERDLDYHREQLAGLISSELSQNDSELSLAIRRVTIARSLLSAFIRAGLSESLREDPRLSALLFGSGGLVSSQEVAGSVADAYGSDARARIAELDNYTQATGKLVLDYMIDVVLHYNNGALNYNSPINSTLVNGWYVKTNAVYDAIAVLPGDNLNPKRRLAEFFRQQTALANSLLAAMRDDVSHHPAGQSIRAVDRTLDDLELALIHWNLGLGTPK